MMKKTMTRTKKRKRRGRGRKSRAYSAAPAMFFLLPSLIKFFSRNDETYQNRSSHPSCCVLSCDASSSSLLDLFPIHFVLTILDSYYYLYYILLKFLLLLFGIFSTKYFDIFNFECIADFQNRFF